MWHVLDKLGVPEVTLVGHSWGSSVVLAMVVAQPQRVRRVALYDAYVYDEQVPSFFRWAQKGGIGEALFGMFYDERIEDRAPLAYFDERWITQARVDRVEAEIAKPGTTAAALAAARGHHFAALHEALAKSDFAKPVLLLWGENDQVTPLRFGQRLANELRDARLVVYPRCGHIPMVEAAGQSTRDLVHFLDEDRAVPAPPLPVPAPAPDSGAPTPESGAGAGAGAGAGERPIVTIPDAPPAERIPTLPVGADLASLGGELTPRLYAAPREKVELVVHGNLRVRTGSLYNLDLDRGLDSRGLPLYPTPLGGGQALSFGDIRARTDIAAYAPGVGVALVKTRIDWLDNVALGADPDLGNGAPSTTTGAKPVVAVVKRAWGEALLPFGTLAAGRMGAHVGLGIVANGGDCEDCDHGDSVDRVALVSPIAGHLVALAYDVDARGPFTRSRDDGRAIALEPTDRVASETASIFKIHSPAALARRAAAGLVTTEYAAYLTHRDQDTDVPASYLPAATPRTAFTPADLVARGFTATGTGVWLRISSDDFRVEAELAYVHANLAHPSLIPGADITQAVTSSQLGFAFESDVDAGPAKLGFDGGYASGDSAPGFGARPQFGEQAPGPGAFDGPQANLPRDHHRRQLPLRPGLPHRPDPVPRDRRPRHRCRLRAPARARRRPRGRPRSPRARDRGDRVVGRRGDVDAERLALPRLRDRPGDPLCEPRRLRAHRRLRRAAPRRRVRQSVRQPHRQAGADDPRPAQLRLLIITMRAYLLIPLLAACGVNQTPAPDPEPTLPECTPNRDGVITEDELPIALGLRQSYYLSPANTHVDLVGDDTGWRLDTESPNDTIIGVGPVALTDQWYAGQFPDGRFIVDAGGGLDSIYHQDDAALWLDGTASQDPNMTLAKYTEPVALLRFPLADGDNATTVAQLPAATIDGLPFIGTDTFTIDVTGREHLDVPYVDFSPVLRVRTQLARQATGTTTKITKRTTLFMFECFGEVARAESAPNEPDPDFTTAAYLRRFALGGGGGQ